jgi:hypothetical protein
MVIRHGLMPAALGLTAGLGIALVLSRTLARLLYGITATDPTTYFSVCMLMLSMPLYLPILQLDRQGESIRWSPCEMKSYGRISWASRFFTPHRKVAASGPLAFGSQNLQHLNYGRFREQFLRLRE